jgi:hypothetical protein
MNRPHGNRARLGGVLLAVTAALAILALPGLASSHGRHHDDHGDAGTIQSFDPATGVLVIDLANDGSVSGLVVRRTHIRCGDDHGHHWGLGRSLRHHPGPGSGEATEPPSRGPNEDENDDVRGDDHGGHGLEPGEDPPGHDGTAPGRSEDPGQGAEHSHRCGVEDLVAGTTVKVAELVLIDGNAFYRLVGLAQQGPDDELEPGDNSGEDSPGDL